jgi:galactonate dehydratase
MRRIVKISALTTVRVDSFPNLLFVEIETEEGMKGLGETFYGADAVESHLHGVAAPLLIGRDPREIRAIATELVGYNGYAGTGAETRARSAVDIALWDLLGKATGQPVHTLLGGRTRDWMRIYNTCAGPGYVNGAEGQAVANWGVKEGELEDLYAAINRPGELAAELLDQGITGMKIWPFDPYAESTRGHDITRTELAEALGRVEAIRSAVGLDMDLMIELHGLWDVPSAQRIVRALEEFSPYWVEDPVRSDIPGGLARVAADTPIRVAAGETVAGIPAFLELLRTDSVGVVTVDTTWSGGLTTARDVATLADAYGIPIAPHDCTGPVALAACVHLCTAAPNTLLQETVRAAYRGWYPTLVDGWPEIADGRIRASERPGHGVSLLPDLYARPGSHVRTTTADDS